MIARNSPIIARIARVLRRMVRLFRPVSVEAEQWPKDTLTTLESQHRKPLVLNTIPRLRGAV